MIDYTEVYKLARTVLKDPSVEDLNNWLKGSGTQMQILARAVLLFVDERKSVQGAVHDFLDEMQGDVIGVDRREALVKRITDLLGETELQQELNTVKDPEGSPA